MPALQNTTNQPASSTQQPSKKHAASASKALQPQKASHKIRSGKTKKHAKENGAPSSGQGSRKRKHRSRRRGPSPPPPLDPELIEQLKRERQQREEARGIGRMTARFIDAFADIRVAFHWGIALENGATLSREQLGPAGLYKRLLETYPELTALMDALGPQVVASQVAAGQAQARSDDVFVIRPLVMQLRDWGINVLELDDKAKRGLRCDDMAMLLIPSDINVAEDHAGVLQFQQFQRALEPHTLPHLCFKDGHAGDNDAMFLNIIPMKCGRAAMHGAQSALKTTRRSGNTTAKKYGIFTVQDEFIAYIHCLSRFALSSEPSFTFDGGNGFDYRVFYKTIVDTMSSVRQSGPAGDTAMANVIKEWNEFIFGAQVTTSVAVPDEERQNRAAEYKAKLIASFKSANEAAMRVSPDPAPDPAPTQDKDMEPANENGGSSSSSEEHSGNNSSSSGEESSSSSDEE